VGKLVAGRFLVRELLGEGATGLVYLAEHQELGTPYAIKILKSKFRGEPSVVERFRREAHFASRLEHPGIVYIVDFGQLESGDLYLIMEYAPGPSLRDVLKSQTSGVMPLRRALEILRQVAVAVAAAHEAGVIHRDLKPDNIVLSPRPGGGERVKILDFGLAKIIINADLPSITRPGEIFGTPDYMAPDLLRGLPSDPRTDIYSLGIIAYEIFTGEVPFIIFDDVLELLYAHQQMKPLAPSQARPRHEEPLPPEVEKIVLRCMEKEPEHRPTRASEVAQVFDSVLERDYGGRFESISLLGLEDVAHILDLWRSASKQDIALLPTLAAGADVASAESAPEPVGEPAPVSEPDPGLDLPWLLEQIYKKAMNLAVQLNERHIGPSGLGDTLNGICELEESALDIETDIALLTAEFDDVEVEIREQEAAMRHAVVDLSLERGRLEEQGPEHADRLTDLGFQIEAQEGRLAELRREREERTRAIEAEISERRRPLPEMQERITREGRRLLEHLFEAKPRGGPAKIRKAYSALELLLSAAGATKAHVSTSPEGG
jgi:serine/threonine protein kinase